MRNILITGGAGFIGSHLTEALLVRGERVVVIDDQSTGDWANLAKVAGHPKLRLVDGSVSDEGLLRTLTADVDEVYHLAAAVGVALVARNPMETIERNVRPTELLLSQLRERVRRGEQVRLLLASTSEVYGKNPKDRWCEDDDLVFGSTTRPRWSYGISKAIDELMALATAREHGLPVVVARFFNVVGPRQSSAYGMVVPRFVEAAVAGRPLVVHDDGQQVRCFAHVQDVIGAVLTLMRTEGAMRRVFNVGSDQPISILELAKLVLRRAGSGSTIEFQSYAEAFDENFEDVRHRVPDLTRLRTTIDYRPQHDLQAIVDELIAAARSGELPRALPATARGRRSDPPLSRS